MTFQGFTKKCKEKMEFKDLSRLCKHYVKYSRTSVTRTLKGHKKQFEFKQGFELSGSIEFLICLV